MPLRVLVVDDHESTRLALKVALEHRGLRVRLAGDGTEALDLLRRGAEPFDWMITDGDMDPIDGFELADMALGLRPDLRVIMISGVYEQRDLKDPRIRKLFPKPLDPDAISDYLKRG